MGYTFTAVLFLNRTGELVRVFFQAAVLFLLIVPVVTMRLFAEERRAGTLELLLTSPVREIEIVLAKFVAGLTLPALMLALTGSYATVLGIYGDPDWGPIYSGFLGLLLLAAALTAIGLLVSGLTSNQIVAAVVAMGVRHSPLDDRHPRLSPPRSLRPIVSHLSLVAHFTPVRHRRHVSLRRRILPDRRPRRRSS